MSFPNCLAADVYEAKIGDILIQWGPNAKANLSADAQAIDVNEADMKAATEHLAHASAERLGKTKAKILGWFHDTTTVTAIDEIKQDQRHCSVAISPGRARVHIYVDLPNGALNELKVQGESVFLNRKIDPTLSTGTYPPQ